MIGDFNMEQDTRTVSELEQQLTEVTSLKEEVERYGTPDFASSLGLRSISNFGAQLQQEIEAAAMLETGYSAEISLDGDPVVKHQISSKFFGQIMVYVQDAINALAFAQAKGSHTRKNLIPNNRIMLAATGPGSFVASFATPEQEEEETLLDVPPSFNPIDVLAQLLDGSLDIDSSSDILANPLVKSKYGQVIALLAKDGASIFLRTKNNPYGVALSAQQARERREWLDLLRSTVEVQSITGTLVGANIDSGRFEIKVGRDSFRGRASDKAAAQIKRIHLGAEVTAAIQVTTTTHEDNNFTPKTSYFLESIQAEEDLVLFELSP